MPKVDEPQFVLRLRPFKFATSASGEVTFFRANSPLREKTTDLKLNHADLVCVTLVKIAAIETLQKRVWANSLVESVTPRGRRL